MVPNYMQIWGIARRNGMYIETSFHLKKDNHWAPDLEELKATDYTKNKNDCTM